MSNKFKVISYFISIVTLFVVGVLMFWLYLQPLNIDRYEGFAQVSFNLAGTLFFGIVPSFLFAYLLTPIIFKFKDQDVRNS